MANFGKKRRFADGGATWDESYRSLSANSGGINQPNTTSGRNASPKVRKNLDDTKARVDKGASMRTFKEKHDFPRPKVKDQSFVSAHGSVEIPRHSSVKDAKDPKSNVSAKSDKQAKSKTSFGSRISEKAKLERLRATRAALSSDKPAGGKTDLEPPKSKTKTTSQPSSTSNGGKRNNKPTKIVSQGNWTNAAPARKPKTLQEAARRNQIEEYNRDKMKSRLKPLFGGKKTSTAKTAKTGAPKKGLSRNWFTAQMQGRNTK